MFARPSAARQLLILIVLLLGGSVSEAALVPYDLKSLSLRSSHIVVGQVLRIESRRENWEGVGRAIFSRVTIRIEESWKAPPVAAAAKRESQERLEGEATEKPVRAREITITLLGGKIGEEWEHCAASPDFSEGETVLVFAREWRGELWVTGWLQGKYRVSETRARRGAPLLRRVAGAHGAPVPARTPLEEVKREVLAWIATAKAAAKNPAKTPAPKRSEGSSRGASTGPPGRSGTAVEGGKR